MSLQQRLEQPSNLSPEVVVQPPQLEVTPEGAELVFSVSRATLYELLAQTAENVGTQEVAAELPN
jgi:hypothetical protein